MKGALEDLVKPVVEGLGLKFWALEHLSEQDVNALLSDRSKPSERWLHKEDHQRVRWYQAAQILRSDSDEAKKAEIESEIGRLVHASEHGDVEVLQAFEEFSGK